MERVGLQGLEAHHETRFVFASNLFEHLTQSSFAAVLDQLREKLKPGGGEVGVAGFSAPDPGLPGASLQAGGQADADSGSAGITTEPVPSTSATLR
jgi:hypothetical protein